MSRRSTIANLLGLVSLVLSLVPLIYIVRPNAFPDHALTESAVLIGGVAGSLLAATAAGFTGSRWWLLALLGTAVDVVCLWGFSP